MISSSFIHYPKRVYTKITKICTSYFPRAVNLNLFLDTVHGPSLGFYPKTIRKKGSDIDTMYEYINE